jgi:hypothetical protein
MGFSICRRINLKPWNKTFVNIIYLGMGRPAKDILYTKVIFEEKEYYVGQIQNNDNLRHFIIDAEDYESVKIHYWHYQSNAYISSAYLSPHDGKRKEVYLHNFVMGRLEFPGKGATESIDHINNNGMDNRKINLRLITQTQQNYNTKRRARVTILPDNCGISADDIPRNIYYMKPNGHHGDRFVVELKGLPDGDVEWKSTSSKSISLQEKLNQAKAKLNELYLIHNLHQQDESDLKKKLADEYNQILELAII